MLLKNIDGSGSENRKRAKRNSALNHHQKFGPARQDGNIGWRKCRTRVEGQEQVIYEPGFPGLVVRQDVRRQSHLREKKISLGVKLPPISHVRTTRIQSPVPGGEDENVAEPKGNGSPQEFGGGLAFPW